MGTIAVVIAMLMISVVNPMNVSAAKPVHANGAKPGSQTIAELAINNGNFTTLVAALGCTNLVPAVSGTNQLTVFAPTDAAFAKLGLNAANVCSVEGLSTILLYHVINGRQTSSSVLARNSYKTLSGSTLTKTEIANAGIVTTNISASNGVIHVIDSVLLP
jgi:uncharacterized surface protein with fasciclin (FAS1) repeats